ncbi:MAG: glutamine-hydrolyzing GMP synthase, partial [Elusimicrobia bacterium]|nr:glutamine-hydrolyzing GMP synthase [Elusimicrobiota bacterium]
MILVLDFGSQYTQLIARRVREQKVYCEIVPHTAPYSQIEEKKPKGIILSGGPQSVDGDAAPTCASEIFSGNTPVLGICYGMQLMAHLCGGKVTRAKVREFGHAEMFLEGKSPLFQDLPEKFSVWMSHGDEVRVLPPGFTHVARSAYSDQTAIAHLQKNLYGVQFHPEVAHTTGGSQILSNFLFRICGEKANWEMSSFIRAEVQKVRDRVGKKNAICALSGGVDSSVASLLVHEAIGSQLHCVFVDHGLQRYGEKERVQDVFGKRFGKQLHLIAARAGFLKKLKGVSDPEKKRKIIGLEFIRVFESVAKKIGNIDFLVQGTLYPDLIESQSVKGPSSVIKTHHNVGGLPKKMRLSLIEPLKFLFKDEVRELGRELGMEPEILKRHPFPGPGLAIRIVGEVTEEKLGIVLHADRIVEEEIRAAGLYENLWQAFAVLIP